MNGLDPFLVVLVMMAGFLVGVRVVDVWVTRRSPSQRMQRARQSLARAVARSADDEPPSTRSDSAGMTRVASRVRRQRLPVGVVLVAVALTLAAVLASVVTPKRSAPTAVGEIQVFERLPRNHVEGNVDYDPDPPVGGPHSAIWQNCGFYSEPVPTEAAVHSLEHGAVWITYRRDLAETQIEGLRRAFSTRPFVLISPFPGLGRPIVASAWGYQLSLSSPTDPQLREFVNTFEQGSQRPEVGGPCSGGAGGPQLP